MEVCSFMAKCLLSQGLECPVQYAVQPCAGQCHQLLWHASYRRELEAIVIIVHVDFEELQAPQMFHLLFHPMESMVPFRRSCCVALCVVLVVMLLMAGFNAAISACEKGSKASGARWHKRLKSRYAKRNTPKKSETSDCLLNLSI